MHNNYFSIIFVGKGFNVNIPWNTDKMGNSEYKKAFDDVVLPIAQQYNPQLVLVSAGFDARDGDELGQYHVTDPMYAYMTNQLRALAGGNLILFLEGGYHPANIAKAAAHCIEALLPDSKSDVSELGLGEVSPSAVKTLQQVKDIQSQFWKL